MVQTKGDLNIHIHWIPLWKQQEVLVHTKVYRHNEVLASLVFVAWPIVLAGKIVCFVLVCGF